MSAARTISTVAVSVFRESVRDKVLYNLVAFAVLLMASTYLLGQLTAGQDIKIIKDLGLAAISLFGLMIAVFIGIGLVWKEVRSEEHTSELQSQSNLVCRLLLEKKKKKKKYEQNKI